MSETPAQSSATSRNDDLSDSSLGEFRLLRRIGAGGMAEVYLAEQTSLGRSVAVKVLMADAVTGKNSVLLKRFEQEARAAGGLSHPNIVQVYLIGKQDGVHYIVQEYVQGQNLSQWIKRYGPPEFLVGLKWMEQTAAALKAASDAGIVHRDIKPENIMVTRSGDAKVTDFGLAQLNQQSEQMNLTQAGTTMGTPWYMSPEQIQGEKLDHRSDQYSFGVTLYHMFAGQPPFPGRNSVGVAVKHLKEQPKPLSDFRRDLPKALCDTIHRMMAKKPEERFQTPDELIAAFRALEAAPLNTEFADLSGVRRWLKDWMPGPKALLTGLAAALLLGLLAGRQLLVPVKLPAAERDRFPREDSAEKQFATAMLNQRNTTAWRAVYEYYPGSTAGQLARLHLALHYATQAAPDYARAEQELNSLYDWASAMREENQPILILTLVAQAFTARLQGNEAEEERIINVHLLPFEVEDVQEALANGPRTLRDSATANTLNGRSGE